MGIAGQRRVGRVVLAQEAPAQTHVQVAGPAPWVCARGELGGGGGASVRAQHYL